MRLALGLIVVLVAAAPVAAQHLGARVQWQPIGDRDSRLAQPVHIEILGRAAVPALELLSEATAVSLAVAPENLDTVGERKLTIISNGLSLKGIMVQLPEALRECHWDIDDAGDEPVYLLHRNAGVEASVEQERQQRRAERRVRYRSEGIAARLSRVDAARRALLLSPRELSRLQETDLPLAQAAQMPAMREVMEIFLGLPDEAMAEFMETGELEFRYEEAPPEVQHLPQVSLELFRQYVAWVESWPAEEQHPSGLSTEEMHAELEQQTRKIEQSSDAAITFRYESFGIMVEAEDMGAPIIPAQHDLGAPRGSLGHFLLAHTGYTWKQALEIAEEWERKHQEAQPGDDPHAWERSLGVRPTDVRLLQSISLPGEEDVVALVDVQRAVTVQTGVSVVGDFFTVSGDLLRPELRAEMPLWHLLAYLRERRIEWSIVGDCLVFHRRQWYGCVQQELPESLVLRYRGRLARQGHFTLDDAIEFAKDIGASAASGQRIGAAVPHDLEKEGLGQLRGYGDSSPLLFYGSLTPSEQAQARTPDGLPLAELPAKGTQDLLRYVPVGGRAGRNRDESARRELARSATFSLTKSAGEQEGAAYIEYVFTFTFPEGADVRDHVVTSTIHLPQSVTTAQTDDDRGSKDQGADP